VAFKCHRSRASVEIEEVTIHGLGWRQALFILAGMANIRISGHLLKYARFAMLGADVSNNFVAQLGAGDHLSEEPENVRGFITCRGIDQKLGKCCLKILTEETVYCFANLAFGVDTANVG